MENAAIFYNLLLLLLLLLLPLLHVSSSSPTNSGTKVLELRGTKVLENLEGVDSAAVYM